MFELIHARHIIENAAAVTAGLRAYDLERPRRAGALRRLWWLIFGPRRVAVVVTRVATVPGDAQHAEPDFSGKHEKSA